MSDHTPLTTIKADLVVKRIIDAPIDLVWKAWTEPDRVMRWWGPQYYTSPSCKMDFREGGKFLFCMRAPQDQGGQDEELRPVDEQVSAQGGAIALPKLHAGVGRAKVSMIGIVEEHAQDQQCGRADGKAVGY